MQKALAAWLLLAASPASLAGPTEVIKVAVEQVVRVGEDLERHLSREESDLFPFLRDVLGRGFREELGRRFEEPAAPAAAGGRRG